MSASATNFPVRYPIFLIHPYRVIILLYLFCSSNSQQEEFPLAERCVPQRNRWGLAPNTNRPEATLDHVVEYR